MKLHGNSGRPQGSQLASLHQCISIGRSLGKLDMQATQISHKYPNYFADPGMVPEAETNGQPAHSSAVVMVQRVRTPAVALARPACLALLGPSWISYALKGSCIEKGVDQGQPGSQGSLKPGVQAWKSQLWPACFVGKASAE